MKYIQQGDVFFVPIDRIPEGAVKREGRVIRASEVSGNVHAVSEGVDIYERDGVLYLNAPLGGNALHGRNAGDGTIVEAGHDTEPLTAPHYRVDIVFEFDHLEKRRRELRD